MSENKTFNDAVAEMHAAIAHSERKKNARISAFNAKINTMKEELPVLKEIAKLLFEIKENL